jgi:hypothetical protein
MNTGGHLRRMAVLDTHANLGINISHAHSHSSDMTHSHSSMMSSSDMSNSSSSKVLPYVKGSGNINFNSHRESKIVPMISEHSLITRHI